MGLNTSGTISIGGATVGQSVNLELGRASSANSSLGESALRSLAGVATGAIALSNFYGKSNLAATLNQYAAAGGYDVVMERSIVQMFASYVEAYVKLVLNTNGTAYYQYGDTNTATTNFSTFTWKTGGGAVGDYYAYMTTPTGDAFSASSATNTALALSTTREWMILASAGNGSEMTVANNSTIQIRNVGGSVLASRTVSMYAFASAPSF